MSNIRIFVSATSGDLGSVRQQVRNAVLALDCQPVEQTDFAPDYRSVREMLRARIESCQALIHIVGMRYGAEPDPTTLPAGGARMSYTQLEYEIGKELAARRGGKRFRVYTLVCPEEFPYDPAEAEDAVRVGLQQAHRATILAGDRIYTALKSHTDVDVRIREIQVTLDHIKAELGAANRWIWTGLLAASLVGLAIFAALASLGTKLDETSPYGAFERYARSLGVDPFKLQASDFIVDLSSSNGNLVYKVSTDPDVATLLRRTGVYLSLDGVEWARWGMHQEPGLLVASAYPPALPVTDTLKLFLKFVPSFETTGKHIELGPFALEVTVPKEMQRGAMQPNAVAQPRSAGSREPKDPIAAAKAMLAARQGLIRLSPGNARLAVGSMLDVLAKIHYGYEAQGTPWAIDIGALSPAARQLVQGNPTGTAIDIAVRKGARTLHVVYEFTDGSRAGPFATPPLRAATNFSGYETLLLPVSAPIGVQPLLASFHPGQNLSFRFRAQGPMAATDGFYSVDGSSFYPMEAGGFFGPSQPLGQEQAGMFRFSLAAMPTTLAIKFRTLGGEETTAHAYEILSAEKLRVALYTNAFRDNPADRTVVILLGPDSMLPVPPPTGSRELQMKTNQALRQQTLDFAMAKFDAGFSWPPEDPIPVERPIFYLLPATPPSAQNGYGPAAWFAVSTVYVRQSAKDSWQEFPVSQDAGKSMERRPDGTTPSPWFVRLPGKPERLEIRYELVDGTQLGPFPVRLVTAPRVAR